MGPAPTIQDRVEKTCSICRETKVLDDFGPDGNRHDGRKRQCRVCAATYAREWAKTHRGSVRATKFKRKYGITLAEYLALRAKQLDRCPICLVDLPALDADEDLRDAIAIDHDHVTGEVRGVLCGPCNKAIGFFRDDPTRCAAAAEYLTRGA